MPQPDAAARRLRALAAQVAAAADSHRRLLVMPAAPAGAADAVAGAMPEDLLVQPPPYERRPLLSPTALSRFDRAAYARDGYFVLDDALTPWVLEVNLSPGLNKRTPLLSRMIRKCALARRALLGHASARSVGPAAPRTRARLVPADVPSDRASSRR